MSDELFSATAYTVDGSDGVQSGIETLIASINSVSDMPYKRYFTHDTWDCDAEFFEALRIKRLLSELDGFFERALASVFEVALKDQRI